MRRCVFYLAVGCITFGLSFFAYISFTFWEAGTIKNDHLRKAENYEEITEQFEDTQKSSKTNNVFKCENQYLLTVWNRLRQDEQTREVLDRGIRQNVLKDCAELIGIDRMLDLTDDGNPGAVITGRGWLNGIAESSNWIVTKNAEDYRLVLDHALGVCEIKKNKTKGFYDISFSFKTSIAESDKILYRFDGNRYKPEKCWTEIIAARDRRQQIYELKKTRKIVWSCWN